MVWDPIIVALLLGLVISGGLVFAFVWPMFEPPDDDVDADAQ